MKKLTVERRDSHFYNKTRLNIGGIYRLRSAMETEDWRCHVCDSVRIHEPAGSVDRRRKSLVGLYSSHGNFQSFYKSGRSLGSARRIRDGMSWSIMTVQRRFQPRNPDALQFIEMSSLSNSVFSRWRCLRISEGNLTGNLASLVEITGFNYAMV